VRRELVASLRARWFVVYSIAFLAAGLLLAGVGLGDTMIYGYTGFAKSFAGLAHLALMFVPLMALFPAVASLAEERDSGALEYMLAQPVSFGEVYAGKWGGIGTAMLLALSIGFGTSGAVVVLRGVPVGLVLTLYALVMLLALGFVGLGLCFSAMATSRARSLTLGIVVWLLLIALGSLGVMAAFVRWGVSDGALMTWTFLNPVEAFRVGVISSLDADLSLLGPVGIGIVQRLGSAGTTLLAAGALAVWALVPGLVGWAWFRLGAGRELIDSHLAVPGTERRISQLWRASRNPTIHGTKAAGSS
jgi:ABC-type transport system involved in multi-copper enzyme maturation permease subunit